MKRVILSVFFVVTVLGMLFCVSNKVSASWIRLGRTTQELEYTVSNGEATIIGCRLGSEYDSVNRADITIPKYLNNAKTILVTSIGENAFKNCIYLGCVSIPNSVTSIGEGAFCGCSGLLFIDIPNSVKSIGYGAFMGCPFKSFRIPDSVETLGNCAFANCSYLKNITIGNSLTSIGYHAFWNCGSLENVKIGESVTNIGIGAFEYCKSLTSVTFSDSVLNIGDRSFAECTSLENVKIGESVTNIGVGAFQGCKSLRSVTFSDSVLSIGKESFKNCTSLENIKIGESVTNIGIGAFQNCKSLSSVTFSDSVTTIEEKAFYNCSFLENVIIGSGMRSIGDSAFFGCVSLKTIYTILQQNEWISNVIIGDHNEVFCNAEYVFRYHTENLVHIDAVPSGCSNDGTIEYWTCSVCGKCYSDGEGSHEISPESIIIPKAHDFGEWYKKTLPTCTEKGEEARICSVCGTIETKIIEELGHNYITTYIAPTCTEKGFEERVCSRCGETETRDVDALGHTHAETVRENEKAATCTADGSYDEVVYCSVCGAELSRETKAVSATGHIPATAVRDNEKATTCTADGSYDEVFYCSVCGAELSRETKVAPATGHTPADAVHENEKAATCTTDGSYDEVVYCSVCGAELSREAKAVPATGHDYVDSVNAPTCTEQGYTTHTCKVCGDAYVDSEVTALGHDFGTDNNAEKCSRCGEKNPDYKPPVNFKDVKAGAYYADAVAWAVAKGVTTGTSATTFSPDEGCTRGQVVTFLWRAAGSPEPAGAKNPFRDVKSDAYYYKAVLWAVENGITYGTSATTFSPDDVCTRGQIVTFLWRANGKPSPTKTTNPFKDVKSGDYFYDAVLWAVEKGITLGTDTTHFSPSDTCTRGQVVTFLYRDANS